MTALYRHPTGGDPRLLIGRCLVRGSRSRGSAEKGSDVAGRPRARQLAATPVARYAVLVFVLAAALVVAVALTLDATLVAAAGRSTRLPSPAARASALLPSSRCAPTCASRRRSSRPRCRCSALSSPATKPSCGGSPTRATPGSTCAPFIGKLMGTPRIASSASITDGVRVLATVTIALPLGDEVLTLPR